MSALRLIWNQISKYYLHPDAETVLHISYLDYIRESADFLKTPKGIAQAQHWDQEQFLATSWKSIQKTP